MAKTLTSQALTGGEARLRENRAYLIRFIEQLDCASCQGELAIDDDFKPEPGFIRFFESPPILATNSARDRARHVAR
jgi:hypothetical protein